MRALLLPALFAFGFGLTGMVNASSVTSPGIIDRDVTKFSPRVQQATHQCRVVTKCDQNGKNCYTVDHCH
ncbi:MAG: hypothetical protein ACLQIQ_11190 [Beijerinckiaceae bacterium]